MRKYQPIWERLKQEPIAPVSLAAPLELHARIIKAVTKEKFKDLGWKLLCQERGSLYRLSYEVQGKSITFILVADKSFRNL